MKTPLPASISIDLDNLWSYLKTHGDHAWQTYPSYFEKVVPRILDFLSQRDLQATFFIVGKDAEQEKNRDALAEIAAAGHEIGNHSHRHEPWLQLYSDQEIANEFEQSDRAILTATGQQPVGFRGPGFSFSSDVLQQLLDRGYQYDASTFPTFLGPMARAYYLLKKRFSTDEKKERKQLFGKFSNGFKPLRPYQWELGEQSIVELPVTTMPIFKLPIHATYLCYLATYSGWLARHYFRIAILLCRVMRVQPSFLLHPLDFLDDQDVPQLGFFPGMKLAYTKKISLLNDCLDMLHAFDLGTMKQHADHAQMTQLKRQPYPVASVNPTSADAKTKSGLSTT